MNRRLICPRDEVRVGNLVDALEASLHVGKPSVLPGAPIPAEERINQFHSQWFPRMSARALMLNLVQARLAFDWATVAIAVSLVQRIRRVKGSGSVTPHMLHRLLIGLLVVATKAHHDAVPSNRRIASTIGISNKELARMEAQACRTLAWRVQVYHDDLVRDEAELCGCSVHIDGGHLIDDQPHLPSPTAPSARSVAQLPS